VNAAKQTRGKKKFLKKKKQKYNNIAIKQIDYELEISVAISILLTRAYQLSLDGN